MKVELKENITQIAWTTVEPLEHVSAQQMIKDQRLDENLMPIITALLLDGIRPTFQDIVGNQPQTRALWHQFHSLVIKDGLLYRKFEHPTGNPTLTKFQLVLPEKHVKSI